MPTPEQNRIRAEKLRMKRMQILNTADKIRAFRSEMGYLHRYHITLDQRDRILEKQGFKCKICKKSMLYGYDTDHDHNTGLVRGLLCHKCNDIVGRIENGTKKTIIDSEMKRKVQDYLSQPPMKLSYVADVKKYMLKKWGIY